MPALTDGRRVATVTQTRAAKAIFSQKRGFGMEQTIGEAR